MSLLAAALWLAFTAPPSSAVRTATAADTITLNATERVPILDGRHDQAFNQALEGAFRKILVSGLQKAVPEPRRPQDFKTWQRTILPRASDFIFTYRILSQEEQGGLLTLTLQAEVYRDKLARAAGSARNLTPALPVRILILKETLALSGTSREGEIDAGRLAATSLERGLARLGAIIISAPDRAPWERIDGRASEENKVSLAAAEGERLGADLVLLGQVTRISPAVLSLSVQLISVHSEATLASIQEQVELHTGTRPDEIFNLPARSAIRKITPKLMRFGSSPGTDRLTP